MSVIRKIMAEPLVQFLILGTVVFGFYSVTDKSLPVSDKNLIEVSKGTVAQMFETYSRTWQRPPTESEFKGLIDGYVKEEIFYREGQKMGLDQDDTVFRRRMQQKMEFLLEPNAEQLTPKPGELEAYLKAHADKYRLPPKLTFLQVFFKSDAPGDEGETAAKDALLILKANPAVKTSTLGNPTLLPESMELTNADMIASSFDEEFARELQSAPMTQWFGPIRSQYGVHLVLIENKVAARAPSLDDVKAAVQSDWEHVRRREIVDTQYAEMRKPYEVKVLWPADMLTPPIVTSGVK